LNRYEIFIDDCLSVMSEMEPESIDLCVTSPPYAEQRKDSYGGIPANEYKDWMLSVTEQVMRLLKPTGSFVLNIKEHASNGVRDRYVLETVLALADAYRWVDTFIWVKKNPFPTGSKRRLKDAFEYCYHFAKTADYKFFPEHAMVPADSRFLESESRRRNIGRHDTANGSNMKMSRRVSSSDMVRPSNVIILPTDTTNHSHPATFPKGLPQRFIDLMTEEGDTVLDPFSGSGTTGVAAIESGRAYVGIEIRSDYGRLSIERLSNTRRKSF
jgi:site-specific DNA-methyltransferase (adenine-specific)/site-specific DNA-methyltransferase (cytosine-N4-specific)